MAVRGGIMFLLAERYRLELHWEKVLYEEDNVCALVGAYFSGPALTMAQKVEENDYIKLDFCNQYHILTKNAHVADLNWGEVVYNKDNTITLKSVKITYDNNVPKLNDTDYIVVDTRLHEEATHAFHLVYESFVVKEDGTLYKF